MPVTEKQKANSIQVIARAAGILRVLSGEMGGLSLGQIATRVNLPRSTVQRIIGSLASEGFVSLGSGNGDIRLGAGIATLARATSASPKDLLRPVMQELAQVTGETVDLAILLNDRMLFIDQIVGSQRLRTVSSIGETFPLTTTANGKAALACLDEAEAASLILAELKSQGTSISRLTPLLTEIEGIRGGAFAQDEDEHTDGVSALGFGLSDPAGDIVAISVPAPSSRYGRQKRTLIEALERARRACEAI